MTHQHRGTASRLWAWSPGPALSSLAPMPVICMIHAVALIALGAVSHPTAVGWAVAAFALILIGSLVVPATRWTTMTRDLAAHVTAGVVIGLDGGTESPFFLWMLLLLAGNAFAHRQRDLSILSGFVVVTYLAVVLLSDDVTASSFGRFGLLVAYCAGLLHLRGLLDRQEAESRRLDLLLRAGFDSAPMGIAVLDENLDPIYINGPADTVMRHFTWGGPDSPSSDEMGAASDSGAGGHLAFEHAMSRAEVVRITDIEIERHVRVLSVPVEAELSQLLLVFAEDVTEQVAAGEERTRFLEAAAHQFRTPLTPVMGYAQMLAEGQLVGEDAVAAGRQIFLSAQEIERVLDKLSVLLKMRTEEVPTPRIVTMASLCDSLLAAIPDAGEAVQLYGEPTTYLQCSPQATVLALIELVNNGLAHGKPPVTLAWTASNNLVEMRIDDAGPGPPMEHGAHLTGVWIGPSQGDTVSEGMGTQLGLTQAAMLVRQGGGVLEFVRREQWHFVAKFPAAEGK